MIYFGVAVIAFMLGILVGAGIVGYMLRCKHQWEKIIDDKNTCRHIVVHRCAKCGKTNTVETNLYG